MSIPMCPICKKQTPYLTPVSINDKWVYVCDDCHKELTKKKNKEQADGNRKE